ncbi:MAG TPA: hypothetical protein VFU14_20340 [Acidimicrobiales bacterium]|nr:hypothetical protein [Acidimicrobiales bacterium]
MSAQLCRLDRETLAGWAEHGIPDDQSTRQVAIEIILPKLCRAYAALDAVLHDVLPELESEVDRLRALVGEAPLRETEP